MLQMRKKSVTFSDIAKHTGFSKNTVSRYFNNPETLTEKNRGIISNAFSQKSKADTRAEKKEYSFLTIQMQPAF